MKELFRLAERVFSNVEKALENKREIIGDYHFEESVIANSKFTIIFSGKAGKIVCRLSIHHLDMPWSLDVKIFTEKGEVSLNKWKRERKGGADVIYETYPVLLNDPEHLGNKLAEEVAQDLITYLKSVM